MTKDFKVLRSEHLIFKTENIEEMFSTILFENFEEKDRVIATKLFNLFLEESKKISNTYFVLNLDEKMARNAAKTYIVEKFDAEVKMLLSDKEIIGDG